MLRLLIAAVLTASGVAVFKPSEPATLNCHQPEAEVLHAAPAAVRRISKHRLSVRWSRGVRTFVDSGIVEGELGGVRYEYCGFALGYHLIHKEEEGLFTGVLLDTATGRLLPAGQTVTFSPDTSHYFATQQPDGLDGEEWLLYSRRGVRLWKGLSGIVAKATPGGYEYFIATLEAPRWSSRGEVEATLRCAADTTRTTAVTLVATGGRYRWMPTVECRETPR